MHRLFLLLNRYGKPKAVIMGWSVYVVISSIGGATEFIPLILQSVGAITISAAIIDVAQYLMEEEVFLNKQLRDPVTCAGD